MLMIKEENEFFLMKRKMETGFINPEQLTALHQNLNMYLCGQLQLEQKTNTENLSPNQMATMISSPLGF